jgi:hypothetical protein
MFMNSAIEAQNMTRRNNDGLSEEAEKFFSLSGGIRILALGGIVGTAWTGLEFIVPFFKERFVGLILSFVMVYGCAYLIPESQNSQNPGKREITRKEIIFGFFNALAIFVSILSYRCLVTLPR